MVFIKKWYAGIMIKREQGTYFKVEDTEYEKEEPYITINNNE